jgi:hypothetical protein
MPFDSTWPNCVLAATLSGLVKSITANQGLKKPVSTAEVIHLGTVQDVVVSGVLGLVVAMACPFNEQSVAVGWSVLVAADPKALYTMARNWLSSRK